jgi:two-component system, chemotaxis family, chemotaxis protein CheY
LRNAIKLAPIAEFIGPRALDVMVEARDDRRVPHPAGRTPDAGFRMGSMHSMDKNAEELVRSAKILIIDDEHYTRKVIRAMLTTMGVRQIVEASDGLAGIDAIKTIAPDVALLDWAMPGLDGPGFMRVVRSPETFPYPDVPVIMLTGHGEKSRVIEAIRLGVHEYLLKPVSSTALLGRILAILTNPRPMIRKGSYYGPEPRKGNPYRPHYDPSHVILVN